MGHICLVIVLRTRSRSSILKNCINDGSSLKLSETFEEDKRILPFHGEMMKHKSCLPFLIFISCASSIPLEPGQPGGSWTSEEVEIVRDKVSYYVGYDNSCTGLIAKHAICLTMSFILLL